MAEVDVAAVQQTLDGSGLDCLPSEDAVWVRMPSQTYTDADGEHQMLIAVAPRSAGLLSLWLVPDTAPPEFQLGGDPDPELTEAVVGFQWDNQFVRFQLGDAGCLQANIDMMVGDAGIDRDALRTSLELVVVAVDGLIGHLRAAKTTFGEASAADAPSETTRTGAAGASASPHRSPCDEIRVLAREAAEDPTSQPEPCDDVRTKTEKVEEPGKGFFKRTTTVERPVTDVSKTHFHGWLLWEQERTSRLYARPVSTEKTSFELWLTVDGELMLVEISHGGAYLVGRGNYPYRKIEEMRPATDEDLMLTGQSWRPVDHGATSAILEDTAFVSGPDDGDPTLAEIRAALNRIAAFG